MVASASQIGQCGPVRRHAITVTIMTLGLLIVGLAVGIWNLVDTQEPVVPVQLAP